MSWSFNASGPHEEVFVQVEQSEQLPRPIKDYIQEGIKALSHHYGDDVEISISGSGHVHDGKEGNWEQTTAHLTVAKKA